MSSLSMIDDEFKYEEDYELRYQLGILTTYLSLPFLF
jgi:hypothetical protein